MDWRGGQGPGTQGLGDHGKAFGLFFIIPVFYFIFIVPSKMGGTPLESFKEFVQFVF